MILYKRRRVWIIATSGLLALFAITVLIPQCILYGESLHLRDVYSHESASIVPILESLTHQGSTTSFQCLPDKHTYIETSALCMAFAGFKYSNTPLPAAARPQVVQDAQRLDAQLKQNGWSLDRPFDPITTIAGSIPSSPLGSYYGTQSVPMHKNIGDISCNLRIDFEGPTNGDSPGVVTVNVFSCQQHLKYFQPHLHHQTFNTT